MNLFLATILGAGILSAQVSHACTGLGGDVDKELISAIETSDLTCVRLLARIGGPNRSLKTPFDGINSWSGSMSPLSYAARLARLDVIKVLVEQGAGVSAQDKNGNSPVAIAAYYKQIDAIRLLNDNGAYLNYNYCRNGNYYRPCFSPLAMAIHTAGPDTYATVDALLFLGASPNLPVNEIFPLSLATIDSGLVDLLVAYGADPNEKNTYGRTALFDCNSEKCVDKMVAIGAIINIEDRNRCTKLDYSPVGELRDALLKNGAKPGPDCKR